MKVTAIVPAAGLGKRLRKPIAKPLIKIAGKEILIRTLEILDRHPLISEIIVATNKRNISIVKNRIHRYGLNKISDVVIGGATRQDSVKNALSRIPKDTDFVLIHDAVRPFIDRDMINRVVNAAKRFGAAIVGVPVKATLKKIKNNLTVNNTIDRHCIWEIQTPQAFKKEIILEAYNKFAGAKVTDDAGLVEKLGIEVKIVKGSYFNIKITTAEDLVFAEAIARSRS